MKRLTLFVAALVVAMSSFATVTYELNGGRTNDLGWTCPQDMYETLNADWNAFKGTDATWKTLAECKELAKGDKGEAARQSIPLEAGSMGLDFLESEGYKAHFAWLTTYMNAMCKEAGAPEATNEWTACLRYNLGAFFTDGHRGSSPATPDYEKIGVSTYSAYALYWGAAYANPTNPTDSVALYAPLKDEFSFDGWYDNAEFTGEPITHVDSTTTGTLYAKWTEYILTIAEVLALEDSAVVEKTAGAVTYVNGGQFYIQDQTGAIQCYKSGHGLQAGDYVILKGGVKALRGKIVQIGGDDLEIEKRAGDAYTPKTTTLAALAADTTRASQSHYVRVVGVLVTWDDDKLYLKENDTKVYIFKHGLNKTTFPEGTKVNANFVVSYYDDALSCYAGANDIVAAGGAKVDSYAYPARGENGEYTLKNRWIYSLAEENFLDNRPGKSGYVRNMVAKNGKMYFADREYEQLVIVDAQTGRMEEPIKFASNLFTHVYKDAAGNDSVGTAANVGLKFNDMKIDNAGNILVANLITSSAGTFQVWKINEQTGEGTLVVEEVMDENPDYASLKIRFDAFGVAGDVNGHAVIMAQDANSMTAFKWVIDNGVASKSTFITLAAEEGTFSTAANPGIAPQIFPISDDYFYVDGQGTYPALFDMEGVMQQDFAGTSANLKIANNPGDTCLFQANSNGLADFQIGDEYFFLLGATSKTGTPPSTYALYKFADEGKDMSTLTPLWYFPTKGMGTETNAFVAVPCVEVDQKTGLATLYLHMGESGYAVYEFQGVPSVGDGLENTTIETVKARKVLRDGQVIIIRNGVEYNVLGAQVK